jgi:hypothetical protein
MTHASDDHTPEAIEQPAADAPPQKRPGRPLMIPEPPPLTMWTTTPIHMSIASWTRR